MEADGGAVDGDEGESWWRRAGRFTSVVGLFFGAVVYLPYVSLVPPIVPRSPHRHYPHTTLYVDDGGLSSISHHLELLRILTIS